MKIAFIVSTFPKLSETFITNQITGLLDMGYDVEIFAEYKNSKEHKIHPDVEKYRLMERTHFFTTPENRLWRSLKAIYLIAKNFHKDPRLILKSVNMFKYGKKAMSLKMLYIVIPFIGKNFDITHCHFGINGALAISLKELGFTGKYITTFHGYDVNSLPKKASSDYYDDLFRRGDLFTVNTNFTKHQVVNLGCDEGKIITLPVGFKIERFEFLKRRHTRGEAIKFLTIGRLVEKKGHEYAIRALAKVAQKHPNVVYYIAGDGPLKKRLESLVAELGLQENVVFLSEVREDEVIRLYHDCHIFLLPSITATDEDREGQALVLQEAQATGMPVLSTIHNGVPEGVLDCKSGYLVPEKNIEALAERMEYLIEHSDLWPEMGRQGRQFVEKKYDIKRLNEELALIYEKLVQNSFI